jgi:hypothetical protein
MSPLRSHSFPTSRLSSSMPPKLYSCLPRPHQHLPWPRLPKLCGSSHRACTTQCHPPSSVPRWPHSDLHQYCRHPNLPSVIVDLAPPRPRTSSSAISTQSPRSHAPSWHSCCPRLARATLISLAISIPLEPCHLRRELTFPVHAIIFNTHAPPWPHPSSPRCIEH